MFLELKAKVEYHPQDNIKDMLDKCRNALCDALIGKSKDILFESFYSGEIDLVVIDRRYGEVLKFLNENKEVFELLQKIVEVKK